MPPPLLAPLMVLLLTTESTSVTFAPLTLYRPPPLPATFPFWMVRPLIVTVTGLLT
jgi:hypothetical protein